MPGDNVEDDFDLQSSPANSHCSPHATPLLIFREGIKVDYRVQQAISLIRDDSHKKLSVAALARDVGLSPSRFHHLFKAETGRSPAQYLHDIRMEQAKVLLETTELTIEQIIIRFGIKDRSHFEREFKKTYGLTPTQHRIAARLNGSAPAAIFAIRRQNWP